MKKSYVLGFLFTADTSNVVLIQKTKPEWQAGKLNGVGGKVEKFDQTAHDAMVREFKEETGVVFTDWTQYAVMESPDWVVTAFKGFSDVAFDVRTTTEERICLLDRHRIFGNSIVYPIISNLHWLIPAALDTNHITLTIDFPANSL